MFDEQEEMTAEGEVDDMKMSKKDLRKAEKEAKSEAKKAKKEEKEKDPFTKLYRSRITPWWGKDQGPDVGEDWKPAKKKYKQPDQRKSRKLFRNLLGYPTR